jgi:hypothetical protein
MEGIKMTNLVKKLSLSLVITTIITTNVLAGPFDESGFEDSGFVTNHAHKPQNLGKTFFDQKNVQEEIAYQREKKFLGNLKENPLQLGDGESENFLNSPSKALIPNQKFEDNASNIFPPLDEEKLQQDRRDAQLRRDNELAHQLAQDVMDGQARNRQPSALRVAGEYTYSAAKTTLRYGLKGLDWVVRSQPVAYYLAYQSAEEILAYGAYTAAGAFGTFAAGPQAGKNMADAAYYTAKTGITITKTMFPYLKGGVAAVAYTHVNSAINAGLDIAPEVVKTVGSVAKTAVETAVSATYTGASYVSSAASYISSFWGK